MKMSCEVIQDLLPLYAEGLASEQSRALVEEHLKTCESCRQELRDMNADIPLPVDNNPSPLLKVQSSLRKKKGQAMILSILVTLVLGIVFAAYVTAPKFYPSAPDRVTITESENGNIIASFGEGVTGYDIAKSGGEEGDQNIYHLVAYSTLWDEWTGKQLDEPVVLNPSGEAVTAVYYYETDGTFNKYLYGEEVYATGGMMLLPRLYFSYYAFFALILFFLSAAIAFWGRKKGQVRDAAIRISFLPLSYLIGHLLIKGTSTSSHSALRELAAIVLVTIPLFLLLLYLYQWLQRKLSKNT